MQKFLAALFLTLALKAFAIEPCIQETCTTPFFTADFIYWKPYLENSYYSVDGTAVNPLVNPTVHQGAFHNTHSHFIAGFKAGVGIAHNDWVLFANFTTLAHHTEHNRVTADPNSRLRSSWLTTFFPSITGVARIFGQASQDWSHEFYQLDLELIGANLYSNCQYFLNPSIGLKTSWIDQEVDVTYTDIDTYTRPNAYFIHSVQDFWGIGPRGALHFDWFVYGQAFALYGDFAFSALFGDFHIHRRDRAQVVSGQINNAYESKYHFIQLTPVLELGLGILCQKNFRNGKYLFSLKLGWENQTWFNFLQLNDPNLTRDGSYTLQGLTARALLAF